MTNDPGSRDFAAQTIARYLDETGFAFDRDRGCEPLPASRNVVGRVWAADGTRRFIVKVGHGRDRAGDGVLLSEGLFHLLARDLDDEAVRSCLPRCVRHDRQADVLIFVEADGRPADECVADGDPATLARIAARLRGVHESTREVSGGATRLLNADLGPAIPADPSLTIAQYAELGSAETVVLGKLHEQPALIAALQALESTWSPRTIVHGDMRLDNVLVGPHDQVCFIDWELCRRGDPATDVGNLLGSVIDASIAATLQREPELRRHAGELARQVLPGARGSCSALLAGYGECSEDPTMPLRAIGYAGVHLIVRVIAHARVADAIGPGDASRFAVGTLLVGQPLTGWASLGDHPLTQAA